MYILLVCSLGPCVLATSSSFPASRPTGDVAHQSPKQLHLAGTMGLAELRSRRWAEQLDLHNAALCSLNIFPCGRFCGHHH